MRLYYAVTAADFREAVGNGRRFVHVAYRVGERSELLRRTPPLQTHGDFMSVSDSGAGIVEHPETLCGAVARECLRRGYRGAVLDFENEPRDDLRAFAGMLQARLRENRLALYVPVPTSTPRPTPPKWSARRFPAGTFRST